MKRSMIPVAVLAGMLGLTACGGGEEAELGGDAGMEATGGVDAGAGAAGGMGTTGAAGTTGGMGAPGTTGGMGMDSLGMDTTGTGTMRP